MSRFLCSVAASDRGEQVFGSASRVDRWLLVESPGSWGPRSLPTSRNLDDALLLGVRVTARRAGARTCLIRRYVAPGQQHDLQPDRRRLFAASSRPGDEYLWTTTIRDAELAELVLPFDGASTAGWQRAESLIAVCTHGSHDTCCAVRGRPVAAALALEHPDETWEISHVGGDRFAANVVVLPEGHYLGQVSPRTAVEAVSTLRSGHRPDPFYRGRSSWTAPTQAAMAIAARELHLDGLDDLLPVSIEDNGGNHWSVILDRADGEPPVKVTIERRFSEARALLTCHAADVRPVPSWALVELAPAVSVDG